MEHGELETSMARAILASVDEAIHAINAQGFTIYYNRFAACLDGLEVDEVLGRHILEVYPSLKAETSTLLRVARTGKPILNYQQTYKTKSGQIITTVNSTIPIEREGQVVGAVEVAKNITKIKELVEQVADLRAKLLQKPAENTGDTVSYTFDDFVGSDPKIMTLKTKAKKAAATSSSILVSGETGTGKELLVQAIHHASPRREGPFIAQNCAAIPESLLEGILFGTAKGGFTGAVDRPGLFELAHGGTLFLDEINSMDLGLQAKLLRVLQEGVLRRVGDTRLRKMDVRVIACTNVEFETAVQQKQIRLDLYYRLNVVSLHIPPLRERKGDIPLLAQYFVEKFNHKLSRDVLFIEPAAMDALRTYHWPGNVRELENAIEGAMNMAEGSAITLQDLPPAVAGAASPGIPGAGAESPESSQSYHAMIADLETNIIAKALQDAGGSVSLAAKKLGLPRQTLQYKIKSLQVKQ
ncbi:ATPase AAA [Clostridiales bacterium PH28_bin88]|nr:ATPase AAA [Clostridiales bacterium PH28_bin88]